MYEIYINDRPLILCTSTQMKDLVKDGVKELVFEYMGKPKRILNFIDMMEKSQKFDKVILFNDNVEQLYSDFCSLYKFIEAAGGLVVNEKGEYLIIYRKSRWDLPKGKREKGEKINETAVREVLEETGLDGVVNDHYIFSTWHTYLNLKGKRALKRTFWYLMKAISQDLTPETEEEIEKAIWIVPDEIDYNQMLFYPNVKKILDFVRQMS